MSRLRMLVTPFVFGFSLAAAAGTVWMEGETYTSTCFPPDVLNARDGASARFCPSENG